VLVAAAYLVAYDTRLRGAAAAGALAGIWIARGWLRGWLRVRAQASLHRRAAAAALAADPLARPIGDADPEVVLIDGVVGGAELASSSAPGSVGDLCAAVGVAALAAATQPPEVVALGAAVLAAAVAAGAVAARLTVGAQDAAWDAYRPLLDRVTFILRSRLEIVANGADARLARDLDALLVRFEETTRRAQRLSAVAGRGPLVAAAIATLVVLAASPRGVVAGGAALANAIVVASVAPTFVGLSSSVLAAWRSTLAFRPLAALLSAPAAPRGGAASPPRDIGRVALHDVAYRYPGSTRDAVSGISLAFGGGAPLVLSGPNGSGKSTLLRILAALCAPSRGSVTLGDGGGAVDLASVDARAWRSRVAYLPQQPYMPESWTVLETASVFAAHADVERLRAALARVELLDVLVAKNPTEPLAVRIGELSVGQRKRVALARILIAEADVVLLDEPDANLDLEGIAMVTQLVAELAADRLVAVAVHSRPLVAGRGVHVELAA
jgi:ATP-binding cassette subfamily C protein CydCD